MTKPAVIAVVLLIGIGATSAASVSSDDSFSFPQDSGDRPSKKVEATPTSEDVGFRINDDQSRIEYENSVCQCVPYYQCNYNGTMNSNGEGIIDIRAGFAGTVDNPVSMRKKCKHYLSVCCLAPEIESAREILKRPTTQSTDAPDRNSSDQDSTDVPETSTSGEKAPEGREEAATGVNGNQHIERGCGVRNVNGVGFRIIGNENNEANFGEYPWMVAILHQTQVNNVNVKVYKCGGSLIHKRVVLTAAHCVEGAVASNFYIRAGEWDTQTENEPLPHQDRRVAYVVTHPAYKTMILQNDYALLIVDKPFDMADNVETVCLPDQSHDYDLNNCHASGWGKDKFGDDGRYQVILKSVTLPIVPRDKCQATLKTTRLGKYFELHNTFLCAGGVDKVDTCSGDGGSPLVCSLQDDPMRYVQVGIVAWGIGCGENNIPGVYADVAKARTWIDQTLQSFKMTSESYLVPRISFQS